jgi:hypothetical protein
MQSWHVTWSSEGRQALAPTAAHRARTSAPFKPLAAIPLEPAYVRPVRNRSHFEWLADVYVLRQPLKHGLATHPAAWDGSCFPDLVGARVLPGLRIRIGDALPRWKKRAAYRAVGLPEVPLEPVDDTAARVAGAVSVAQAAANAVAADPTLRGRAAPEVLARRITMALGTAAGIATTELAWAMGITPDAATRLAGRPVGSSELDAARLRLSLDRAVAAALVRPPG